MTSRSNAAAASSGSVGRKVVNHVPDDARFALTILFEAKPTARYGTATFDLAQPAQPRGGKRTRFPPSNGERLVRSSPSVVKATRTLRPVLSDKGA